ncbi:MAG TPA: hypothetical protein VGD40_02275 [Chryseosolibacter sp.]
MTKTFRRVLAVALAGPIWYCNFVIFFVMSGAQAILASPEHQSEKMLANFFSIEPLPRMNFDEWLVLKAFVFCGGIMAGIFIFLDSRLKGTWLKRGLTIGVIFSLVMVPWFEFYLPYNVMNEPLSLIAFEFILWNCVLVSNSLATAVILNYKRVSPE